MNPPIFFKNDTVMDFNGRTFEFSDKCNTCTACSLDVSKRIAGDFDKPNLTSCSRFGQDHIFRQKAGASMPTFMKCEGRDDGKRGVWVEVEPVARRRTKTSTKKKVISQDPFEAAIANKLLS
jgi:hypothetical protein